MELLRNAGITCMYRASMLARGLEQERNCTAARDLQVLLPNHTLIQCHEMKSARTRAHPCLDERTACNGKRKERRTPIPTAPKIELQEGFPRLFNHGKHHLGLGAGA
jgi:hypothetical protein